MYVALAYVINPLKSQHAQEPESYVGFTFGPFDTDKEAKEWAESALPSQDVQIMRMNPPC